MTEEEINQETEEGIEIKNNTEKEIKIQIQEKPQEETLTEQKKRARKGISWKQKYNELNEKYETLLGKLDEEVADIETPDDEEEVKNKCPNCNAEVEDYAPYCKNCGNKILWSDED